MKQKLLSILTLLVLCVTGAWAQETFTFAWTSNGTAGYSYSQAGPTGGELIANNAIYFVSNQGPKADASKLNPYRVGFVFKPTTNVTVKIKGSAGSSARTIQDIKIDEQVDERFYSLCKDAVGSNKTVMQYALDNASDENKEFFKNVGLLKVKSGVYSVAGDAKSASGETAQASLYDNRTAANNISISANSENEEILNTGTPASNFTFEAGNVYRIYMTTSSSTGTQLISFTFSSAAVKKSTNTTINVPGGFNKDIKNGTTAGTLTATVTPEGESALVSPAITWSSSNKDVADITSAGVVTLKTEGTTTITASYAGDETYAASSAEYSLTVTDSRTEITPSLTYDNTTLILGQTTTATPTLTGNTGSGTVTYTSDKESVATVDAETGVVTAVAVGIAHITASVAATSDYRAGSAQATITVANNPLGSHTVTYTLDVTSEEDKNKTDINSTNVSTSLSLNTLIGITNNTGGSYTKGSKTNLTVKIPTPADYDENNYMSVGFTVADGYVFVPTTVSVKAQPVTTNKDVKLVLTNGTKSIDKTQTCTAGSITTVTMTNDEEVSLTGDVTLKIYCYGATDTYRLGSPITISGDVIKVDQVNIAANKEWITYCSTNALDFSEDIEGLEGAYTISSHTSGATTLTATKMSGAVKAGTGLLLHAANVDAENAQVIRIPVAASGDEQSGNMLKGVIVATAIEPTDGIYTNLGLKNGSFVPYSAAGTIAANKAYLQIPTADMPTAGDAKLTIIFDNEPSDETTAIAGVEVKKGAGVVYNLAGQRVSNPTKGLYIINGKKVIIK